MMTQGVITQAAGLMGSTSRGNSAKGKSSSGGFDLIMNNNLKTSVDTKLQAQIAGAGKKVSSRKISNTVDTKASDVSDKDKAIKAHENVSDRKDNENLTDKTDNDRIKDDNKANQVQKKSSDSTDQTKPGSANTQEAGKTSKDQAAVTEDLSKDLEDGSELAAQIMGMLQSVGEAVMDMLKLSPEEFNQMLSDNGLSIKDLLNPDVLKQFVLTVSGKADISDFLTDEKLADTMTDLLDKIADIKDKAGLNLTDEQLKAILKDADAKSAKSSDAVTFMQAVTEITDGKKETAAKTVIADNSDNKQVAAQDSQTGSTEKVIVEASRTTDAGESSGQARQDSGRNSDAGLDAAKQLDAFIDNLVKNTQELKSDFNGVADKVSELKEIANQIIERIKVIMKPEQTSMELQLNPESLGKVNLTIQQKNGAMTAQFVVQNEVAKEAIESQIQTLRDTLSNQGVKVEAIEVTVSSFTFEQGSKSDSEEQTEGQKKSGGHKLTLDEAVSMKDTEDEQKAIDITGVSGSQIDYTA